MNKPFVIIQHDSNDCGAICLLTISKYYGCDNRLEYLRQICGTSTSGTSLFGLYAAAKKLGFKASGSVADNNFLISHNKPTILHVTLDNNQEHYVVCWGYSKGKFVIGDPSIGLKHLSNFELEKIWLSKACLIIKPNPVLHLKNKFRVQWLKSIKNYIKPDLNKLFIAFILGLIISILGLSLAFFSQYLIDFILPSNNISKLIISLLLLTILLILKSSISALKQYILVLQAKDFNTRILGDFYSKIIKLPKLFFDTRQIGDITARLHDTRRVQSVTTHIFSNILVDILVFITSLSALFYFSIVIGSIALITAPLIFIIIYSRNHKILLAQKEMMVGFANSESIFIQTIKNIQSIKIFNAENYFTDKNLKIYDSFQNKVKELSFVNIILGYQSSIFGILSSIAIISVGSIFVLNSQLKIGELIAIISISNSLLPSLSNIAILSIPLNEAKTAMNRVEELLILDSEESNSGVASLPSVFKVEAKTISFGFPSSTLIFKNLNFKLVKGEITALVGESGKGKSTLCQLLMSFYKPLCGSFIINNDTNLKSIKIESWRNLIGYVPQEINIFDGSVLENIYMHFSEEYDENLNGLLNFEVYIDFINNLPEGLNTKIGENGINLSGGQKQILGLARALVKNPQFLILDEITSSLDTKNETLVINLLKELSKDKIILFCTHRNYLLKNFANKTLLIDNKRLVTLQ